MAGKRIFFLATDDNAPSGGRMFIYRLVDMLAGNGCEAYALHQKRNFRYTWFNNATPVCYTYQLKTSRIRSGRLKHWLRVCWGMAKDFLATAGNAKTRQVTVTEKDILVLPATRTSFCNEILPGTPKISLSQGPYLLLQCMGLEKPDQSIFHPDIKARIAMSRLNYDVHRRIFPKESVWHVPVFVDRELYGYEERKKCQIAYMPRRLPNDSRSLINLLRLRGNLDGFTFVPIDGVGPHEVARIMKESLVFLSFSHRDGFGLPPAEAMACGCVVVGYSGNGGDEFFLEDFCFKIADGDLISFAEVVEDVIREYGRHPERLDAMRRRASAFILENYSRERTEQDLLTAWSGIMKRIAD